jgi:hypothetical protein
MAELAPFRLPDARVPSDLVATYIRALGDRTPGAQQRGELSAGVLTRRLAHCWLREALRNADSHP